MAPSMSWGSKERKERDHDGNKTRTRRCGVVGSSLDSSFQMGWVCSRVQQQFVASDGRKSDSQFTQTTCINLMALGNIKHCK